MPSFAVPDGTGFVMNYEVHPGLVPVTTLFIHGNLASNRWWLPAQEVWAQRAVGQNYSGSLIYAEFRGCGHSSAPKQESEVDMHRFAEDFIALLKNLKFGPVNIVGHSTGGLIAALMLAKAPELFQRAVLLDPVGARGVKFEPAMVGAFQQMKTQKDLVATVLGATIYENDSQGAFFNQVLVEDGFSAVKAVGHLVIKALDGLDSQAIVSKVQHSVLVLHGEFDGLLDRKESEHLASLMKNAQFRVIPGQGHCCNIEAPSKFVDITRQFLFS